VKKKQHWSLPISDAFAVFDLHCQAQRYRPSTLEFYRWHLHPFGNWLATRNITALDQVTSHHIRAYLVDKQILDRGTDREREAAGHYVHSIARALRAFFRFCVDVEKLLTVSPMDTVKMPRRPKQILAAFEPVDIRRLLRTAQDLRETTLIHFLLDTGIRATECIRLKIGDVNTLSRTAHVRHGKGDKERIVYFGAKTGKDMIKYINTLSSNSAKDPLWQSQLTGKALTYSGLAQLLRRLGKAAGVDNCEAHTFRRTFALNSLRNGMDVYTLARLMGHADITVLRQYLALAEQDLKAAHEQFGVVDNL
jgi:integrase/recombinase XerD